MIYFSYMLLNNSKMMLAFLVLLLSLTGGAHGDSSDTWAVIVCTSRFWFNYRHMANALAVYKQARRLGIEDDHIVLMTALEANDDSRNPFPGRIFSGNRAPLEQQKEVYATNNATINVNTHTFAGMSPSHVEVDYGGEDCSADNFLQVLTGRHTPGTALSKQLRSGPDSKVLVYLTGHGGDGFLKFHDQQELGSADLAHAFQQMWAYGRYAELLLVIDTCQAATMGDHLSAPYVTYISSSNLGENSYAYDTNHWLGLAVMDRFTFQLTEFLSRIPSSTMVEADSQSKASAKLSVADMVSFLRLRSTRRFLYSTVTVAQTARSLPTSSMHLKDFFGQTNSPGDRAVQGPLRGMSEAAETGNFDTFPTFGEWTQQQQ
jgi:glycosylphosphatidylinositol transamidase (GPIT) subunit GPI8